MPRWHGPQTATDGRYGINRKAHATHIARRNRLVSNGFKIALCYKRQKPAQGLARPMR